MSNNACNCCQSPPCPTPWLEFVSRSATCTTPLCGAINPDDGLRYMVKTTQNAGEFRVSVDTFTLDPTTGVCSSVTTCSGTRTSVYSMSFSTSDGSYSEETTSVGTYAEDCSVSWVYTYTGSSDSSSTNRTCTSTLSGSDTVGGNVGAQWNGSVTQHGETWEIYDPCLSPAFAHLRSTYVSTTTHTPEPTTEHSVVYSSPFSPTPCELEFPEFPEFEAGSFLPGQGFANSAFRSWSEDELNKSEREIQWRLRHQPTGTCYLKVWLEITTAPTVGEPIKTTEEYTWNGSGNPCVTDLSVGVNDESNNILGAPNTLTLSENGTATVAILKYSCLPGYEPDISNSSNPQPNGFPSPSWTP